MLENCGRAGGSGAGVERGSEMVVLARGVGCGYETVELAWGAGGGGCGGSGATECGRRRVGAESRRRAASVSGSAQRHGVAAAASLAMQDEG